MSIPCPLPARPARIARAAGGLALAAIIPIAGCSSQAKEQAPEPPPTEVYRGPEHLHGTVGSMTRLRNHRPLPVAGYGLVVGLNGTGSSEVPAYLREDITDTMRKRGLGSARYGTQSMTPDRVLADENTAVVIVRGLVPAGASEGSRFDVLVSALEGTQTTSLVGGRLWTTELGLGGGRPGAGYVTPRAEANGDIYVNPFNRKQAKDNESDFVYHALVVAGGEATESRNVELVLNQASWTRSRLIADRINERFPSPPSATQRTAEAQNDLLIRLNVPPSYSARPEVFVRLVRHLYTQRSPNFAANQARRLVRELRRDPDKARRIALAWQSLGKTVIPVLRQYYGASNLELRLAALEAGARLEDERASQYLRQVASHEDPEIRQRVAEALVHLPRSLKGSQTLKRLLDDDSRQVRIAAYESLSAINDPILDRTPVYSRSGELKYVIDRVPAEKPLVYITPEHTPRVAIFQPELSFEAPMLGRIWDNHLMVSREPTRSKAKVFYQSQGDPQPKTKYIAPLVGRLVYYLGHEPAAERPGEGLGLSYSRVVDAVYQLCQKRSIPAPVEVKVSELAKQVDDADRVNPRRPESGPGPRDMIEGEAAQRRPVAADQRGQSGEAGGQRPGGGRGQPRPQRRPQQGQPGPRREAGGEGDQRSRPRGVAPARRRESE